MWAWGILELSSHEHLSISCDLLVYIQSGFVIGEVGYICFVFGKS